MTGEPNEEDLQEATDEEVHQALSGDPAFRSLALDLGLLTKARFNPLLDEEDEETLSMFLPKTETIEQPFDTDINKTHG